MVNESKVKEPRFWERWKYAGAIGTVESAHERELLKQGSDSIKLDNIMVSSYNSGSGLHLSYLPKGSISNLVVFQSKLD